MSVEEKGTSGTGVVLVVVAPPARDSAGQETRRRRSAKRSMKKKKVETGKTITLPKTEKKKMG